MAVLSDQLRSRLSESIMGTVWRTKHSPLENLTVLQEVRQEVYSNFLKEKALETTDEKVTDNILVALHHEPCLRDFLQYLDQLLTELSEQEDPSDEEQKPIAIGMMLMSAFLRMTAVINPSFYPMIEEFVKSNSLNGELYIYSAENPVKINSDKSSPKLYSED